MSDFVPRFGEGQNIVLFRSKEATKENKRPHYSGYISINGEIHEVALWGHKSPKGTVLLSGAYKPPKTKSKDNKEEKTEKAPKHPKKKKDVTQ
jgi:hypothetical protein